ncbi:MAG: polynucleotide adenylyltransferase, partial [Ruminococcus sp.]
DILSQSKYKREYKLNNIALAQETLNLIISNDECFNLKKLAINGSDLLHLGITDGKTIGFILENLLDSVIDETIENDNILLKKKALEIFNQI